MERRTFDGILAIACSVLAPPMPVLTMPGFVHRRRTPEDAEI